MKIEVQVVDYHDPQQGQDLVALLNDYALDAMGGGEPLAGDVTANLVARLAELDHAVSLICYVDGQPAGLTNAFYGFSTFKAKPLINIHDITVKSTFRGLGISQRMLAKLEDIARQKGCCKVTLEVLQGNTVAQNAYLKAGFAGYQLDPEMGDALFWQKSLV
ncbi:GNAT family N-acetyltransferase [Motilimonas eburnea]|uniref:GNAT family N-acetyltransferase n=1 Tax=Motilimonas eburnea TaxID=1737488 RepID=UPI001E5BFD0D|nr:GNAT family N-acetyltransferase [Motilimonas eburnea]MCE2570862.1 GNAT family N-acetyltransferase [Motilimonas eburnea]